MTTFIMNTSYRSLQDSGEQDNVAVVAGNVDVEVDLPRGELACAELQELRQGWRRRGTSRQQTLGRVLESLLQVVACFMRRFLSLVEVPAAVTVGARLGARWVFVAERECRQAERRRTPRTVSRSFR